MSWSPEFAMLTSLARTILTVSGARRDSMPKSKKFGYILFVTNDEEVCNRKIYRSWVVASFCWITIECLSNEDGNANENVTKQTKLQKTITTWECNHLATLPPSSLRPVSTSANSAARPSDGLCGHAQLEIQAESERLQANAQSVLEVESSSTFSRPEWAKSNQISSFQC